MSEPGESSSQRLMMLSIHPRHVNNILAGTKTVELRRTKPAVESGQPVAIYATVPSGAIVATCRIERIQVEAPLDLWPQVADAAAVSKQEFDQYYVGNELAVALHLTDVAELHPTVSLLHLRQTDGFHPPQTWHFLDQDRIGRLLGPHPSLAAFRMLLHG